MPRRKKDCKPGPPCEVENCRSTLFYEEDGFRYCQKSDHQQEGLRTQQDDDYIGSQSRKTRVKREKEEQVSRISRGHTAVSLYLQCYQLIIWKQCYALIHTIGLPPELENVVKDLWELRLQLVKDKTDATDEESAVFSSQPVSDADTDRDEESLGRTRKIRAKTIPSLIETLGLLYLGMVLLHLPISMGDVHRWATREDVPYIRAIRFVPAVMKHRLPAQYLMTLDTTTPLEPDDIRKSVHNLSLFYTHYFQMIFPPINAELLLYRHIRHLTLPLTLHPLSLSISSLLNWSFIFPTPKRRQRTSSLPEPALVSLLVIATKLYHPFDKSIHSRKARSLADPAAIAIHWPSWVKAQEAHDDRLTADDLLPHGSEIKVTEQDVMSMTGNQLDQYMDFYERTFIDEERAESKSRGLPKQLLDMFPTGRQDGSAPVAYKSNDFAEKEQASLDRTLASVIGSLQIRPIAKEWVEDDDTEPKIGSFYKRYRRVDDLEGAARVFHEKVADMVGIKLETLLVAVNQIERNLIRWREAQLRAGEASEDDSDDSVN